MEVRKDRITEYIGMIDDVAIGASRHSTIFGRAFESAVGRFTGWLGGYVATSYDWNW